MTDEELRQLIESNARAVQANSESIRHWNSLGALMPGSLESSLGALMPG
jgi:hypothetical protein